MARIRSVTRLRFARDSLLEGSRFEPSVPPANGLLLHNLKEEIEKGGGSTEYPFSRGTEGSNPACSSGESANHRFRCRRGRVATRGDAAGGEAESGSMRPYPTRTLASEA